MEIYLWKKLGKGVDVITELSLVDSQSRDANVRIIERGDKVAHHANLQFQLIGICAMKHNAEGYPVNDIDVAMSEMVSVYWLLVTGYICMILCVCKLFVASVVLAVAFSFYFGIAFILNVLFD